MTSLLFLGEAASSLETFLNPWIHRKLVRSGVSFAPDTSIEKYDGPRVVDVCFPKSTPLHDRWFYPVC